MGSRVQCLYSFGNIRIISEIHSRVRYPDIHGIHGYREYRSKSLLKKEKCNVKLKEGFIFWVCCSLYTVQFLNIFLRFLLANISITIVIIMVKGERVVFFIVLLIKGILLFCRLNFTQTNYVIRHTFIIKPSIRHLQVRIILI